MKEIDNILITIKHLNGVLTQLKLDISALENILTKPKEGWINVTNMDFLTLRNRPLYESEDTAKKMCTDSSFKQIYLRWEKA